MNLKLLIEIITVVRSLKPLLLHLSLLLKNLLFNFLLLLGDLFLLFSGLLLLHVALIQLVNIGIAFVKWHHSIHKCRNSILFSFLKSNINVRWNRALFILVNFLNEIILPFDGLSIFHYVPHRLLFELLFDEELHSSFCDLVF